MNDNINNLEKELSILKQEYKEKKDLFQNRIETDSRDCLSKEQREKLTNLCSKITKLENQINREKASQEFNNKATCISNNQKTHSLEQQNVTDTSQTN